MNTIRTTQQGPVQGFAAAPGINAWLGIPYARAGRWEYPAPPPAHDGVFAAGRFGDSCPQIGAYAPEVSRASFYFKEFNEGVPYTYSEQCQNLNIWAADGVERAPVLVYIHGGAFMNGSTQEKPFDGAALAKKGLVVVTVGYRLGVFGFASLPELSARDGHTGSYGLYDLAAALDWVQQNIAAFGGDPHRVTLMGQSAGARLAKLLSISPLTAGKIHRTVLLSGGGTVGVYDSQPTPEMTQPVWQDLAKEVGAADLDALLAADPADLVLAYSRVISGDFRRSLGACLPVKDGALVPDDLEQRLAQGTRPAIPTLICYTCDDLGKEKQLEFLRDWAKTAPAPTYGAYFDRRLPGDENGGFHSADLWFWFGTLDHCWRPFVPGDYETEAAMTQALCTFAAAGDPGWPACDGETPVQRFGL